MKIKNKLFTAIALGLGTTLSIEAAESTQSLEPQPMPGVENAWIRPEEQMLRQETIQSEREYLLRQQKRQLRQIMDLGFQKLHRQITELESYFPKNNEGGQAPIFNEEETLHLEGYDFSRASFQNPVTPLLNLIKKLSVNIPSNTGPIQVALYKKLELDNCKAPSHPTDLANVFHEITQQSIDGLSLKNTVLTTDGLRSLISLLGGKTTRAKVQVLHASFTPNRQTIDGPEFHPLVRILCSIRNKGELMHLVLRENRTQDLIASEEIPALMQKVFLKSSHISEYQVKAGEQNATVQARTQDLRPITIEFKNEIWEIYNYQADQADPFLVRTILEEPICTTKS